MLIAGIVVAVAIALFFGIKYMLYATSHESTDDAKVDADTVTITSKISERVAQVVVDTNQFVRRGQIVVRLDDRDERAKLANAVANRDAMQAQARAARSTLSLTVSQQAAQNEQSSGAIASAQAQISNAVASAASAGEQVAANQAAVAQAEAQLHAGQASVPSAAEALKRAQADLDRTASLVATGDVARQTLDADRSAQAQARAEYLSALDTVVADRTAVTAAQARTNATVASAVAARATISAQQGQLTTANGQYHESDTPFKIKSEADQYAAAQAQLKAAQAQVVSAQNTVDDTIVRAPIDGYIGSKSVEIGATVAPGQSLLGIVPNNGTYITANFKETQLGKIRVGAPVDISVDAYKGTAFTGHVSTIAPASQNTFSEIPAQNSTGNYVKVTQRLPVRIIVTDPPHDKPLRVGMSVTAAVHTK
ncbi:MAG: HlyD family secretion protein [Candidatus Eremiobacteraeota bacterium]|nr:HlyD family secretion protein [Candidatus Eremiobacteraeota bacterium]